MTPPRWRSRWLTTFRQRPGNGAARAARRGGVQPWLPPFPGHDARAQHGDARSVSRLGLRDSIEIGRGLYRRSVVARGVGGRRRGRGRAEPPATAASICPLLAPRAVAVIGASRNPSNIGRRVLDAIAATGFTGPVYAVNPHATDVGGIQTYASARELPNVDLAVIAVPAAAVSGVVDDCAAAGIRSIVVISAGFAETGSDGRALQHALTDKVRGYGMRMVGPNCMGVLNTDPAVRLNASFRPSSRHGHHRIPVAERRAGDRDHRAGVPARAGLVHIRQRGQQGRRVGQRPARVLGRRRRDARGPSLSRVLREPAPLRPSRAQDRPQETDRRREVRTHARRIAGGEQPHRRARGERRRRRCAVSSIRRDSCGHDGRDVRRRRVPRYAAPPAGTSCRDRHQRRRTGHPCRRRV